MHIQMIKLCKIPTWGEVRTRLPAKFVKYKKPPPPPPCTYKWSSYVKYPHGERWEQGCLPNSWNIKSPPPPPPPHPRHLNEEVMWRLSIIWCCIGQIGMLDPPLLWERWTADWYICIYKVVCVSFTGGKAPKLKTHESVLEEILLALLCTCRVWHPHRTDLASGCEAE